MRKRMRMGLLFVFMILFLQPCFSQDLPELIGEDLSAVRRISDDWKVLTETKGDLNNDGKDDFCIILESVDSISENRKGSFEALNKPRIILVLLNRNGNPITISQNNDFIARANEGGMAGYFEPSLSISEGLLTIDYEFVRSSISYKFRYADGKMLIVSARSMNRHAASGDFEINHFDFQTGEIKTVNGNIAEEEDNTAIFKFDVPAKSLNEFGPMFEWEIIEYKYL